MAALIWIFLSYFEIWIARAPLNLLTESFIVVGITIKFFSAENKKALCYHSAVELANFSSIYRLAISWGDEQSETSNKPTLSPNCLPA